MGVIPSTCNSITFLDFNYQHALNFIIKDLVAMSL